MRLKVKSLCFNIAISEQIAKILSVSYRQIPTILVRVIKYEHVKHGSCRAL